MELINPAVHPESPSYKLNLSYSSFQTNQHQLSLNKQSLSQFRSLVASDLHCSQFQVHGLPVVQAEEQELWGPEEQPGEVEEHQLEKDRRREESQGRRRLEGSEERR